MSLKDALVSFSDSLGMPEEDEYEKLETLIKEFSVKRYYSVEIVSFRKGLLVLQAPTADAVFAKYDIPMLLHIIKEHKISVSRIRVKTKV